MFNDHSIDIATGTLLGRYIAEERDTGRMLRCCYEQLKSSGETTRKDEGDRLSALEAKLDAVCSAIGDLQSAMTASKNGNGTARAKAKTKTSP
jgi:hypothetical protein